MIKEPFVWVVDPDDVDREFTSGQIQLANLEYQPFVDIDGLLQAVVPNRVGCVLAELKLGGSTAFQLVKLLRQRTYTVPVVLLTSHATVPLTIQAFRAGIFDVVQKPGESFQLWECVTRAFETHEQSLQDSLRRNGIKNRISHLSRQELQVLQMILDGEANKRIACRLGVSQRTIVFRRKSLMEKMKAKSVAELACMVRTVTSEAVDPETNFTSLLDVHVAASVCNMKANGENGDGSFDASEKRCPPQGTSL